MCSWDMFLCIAKLLTLHNASQPPDGEIALKVDQLNGSQRKKKGMLRL